VENKLMGRREPHFPGAAVLAVEPRVQARLAREFQRKNQIAVRSVERNAAVIEAGAVRNAELGVQPFLGKRRQRRGKR
jgi:hypothetical protein